MSLALCHNVTPVINTSNNIYTRSLTLYCNCFVVPKVREDPARPDEVTYQASSPDEIALVKFSEQVSFYLILLYFFGVQFFKNKTIMDKNESLIGWIIINRTRFQNNYFEKPAR